MPISRLCGGTFTSDWPLTRISPLLGVSKPASIDSVVLLPEPLEPRKVRNSPSLMSSEMSSTAAKSP
ncbi:hypothetical protein D3C86_1776120 [compost metagenome]